MVSMHFVGCEWGSEIGIQGFQYLEGRSRIELLRGYWGTSVLDIIVCLCVCLCVHMPVVQQIPMVTQAKCTNRKHNHKLCLRSWAST